MRYVVRLRNWRILVKVVIVTALIIKIPRNSVMKTGNNQALSSLAVILLNEIKSSFCNSVPPYIFIPVQLKELKIENGGLHVYVPCKHRRKGKTIFPCSSNGPITFALTL